MLKTTIPLLSLLFILLSCGPKKTLYIIVQHDKIGFIDSQGTVVIKPVFMGGSDFSEGLAAVRPDGRYGYIDEQGDLVIKPEFDVAYPFTNGLAQVYKNGQPYFIDKTGQIALPTVYTELKYINTRKAIVTTQSEKQGLIDIITKKLIIDTVFESIEDFNAGVAIAYKPTEEKYIDRIAAVIDTNGNFIVPFGKYNNIKPFSEGYAQVEVDSVTDGAIDTKGNLIYKRPSTAITYVSGNFHNGYAPIDIYTSKRYAGFINLKGEMALYDTTCEETTDFSNGRAFIQRYDQNYILIDRNLKQVGKNTFDKVPDESFKNGYAIVQTAANTGIIDTNGNYLIKPIYNTIDPVGIVDGHFFFGEYNNQEGLRYGMANLKGKVIIKPVMKGFDRNGFVNGIIKASVDNKLTYINKNGKIVWQEKADSAASKALNIDFMMRGYFYAYSTPTYTAEDRSGGWAVSANIPHKITTRHFPGKQLSITIDTKALDTFAHQYIGYKLYLSNTTGDTLKFKAQDSRLYMTLQAQNEKGEWKDIEYLPSSFCGNSYHQLELEPNAYWQFIIPQYHGEIQTKIRAALTYIEKPDPIKETVIYSNIINGSVNPGQFWNKQTYYPTNIMDPYFD